MMAPQHPLPAHWEWKTLAEVGRWSSGGTPKSSVSRYYDGPHPWAVIGDLRDGPVSGTERSITGAGLAESSAKLVPPGTLLVAMYGSIGKLGIATTTLATNQAIACCLPNSAVDVKWLFYWLLACRQELVRAGKGGTQRNISQAVLRSWPVPVAPREEQVVIVEAVERMLSRAAAAEGSFEMARQRLRQLQTVIEEHAAYGRLDRSGSDRRGATAAVASCRGDRDPDTILRAPLPAIEIPDSWVWSSVDEVADVQSGAAKSKRLDNAPGCVERPYLAVANVQRGYLDLSDVKTMWVRESKLEQLTLQAGDVLFNEGGDKDKLGRGWVWEDQVKGCVHQNHVFRARLRGAGIEPRWLSHWGNVFGRWWFHERGSQTTGIASINKTVLRSLPVPIPPPQVQRSILEGLERSVSSVQHTGEVIDEAVARSGALRRSILKAAFEGRLTNTSGAARSAQELEEAIA